jgi:1-aminocyclopropane-1-carboxylate deaminase/D-cysteine desulfhydrase-like pyridoxal-dependent ACC family enzyme
MICDTLPRQHFAYLPTPLEEAPRLSAALGGPRLLIKRDDRSGLTFGGNKARIFEFVFGDALAQGATVMITAAGTQSNHLREVTAAANKLGLKSVIIVCGPRADAPPQGNLFLFHLLGADIRYYPTFDPHSPELWALMHEIEAELKAQGHKPYLVHFDLRAGLLGSASHANAAEEMAAQFKALGVVPDYVYVPAGSGVTTSGFVLGFKHLGLPTRVVAVSLIWPAEEIRQSIARHANRVVDDLGLSTRVEPDDYDVIEYRGAGYGKVTPPITEALRLVAGCEGILLDPVYNGKAMAALIEHVRGGRLTKKHTAVLVHTGGTPALFHYNRELMAE